ncbi:MAG: prolyl oligopeptidase family serine peptidase, partial [Armatimonadetes bacterium]|nr:prolyl oligopeptidase family serine peptidase [Armatimonadota bacterium]
GDFAPVVAALRPTPAEAPETGLLLNREFRAPHLRQRRADDRFSLHVPHDYRPDQPRGLVLFLHGGGRKTPRDAGAAVFESYRIADLLTSSGFMVAAPAAPFHPGSYNGWNLPEADELVMDVIEELEHAYAIDPDRVFIAGTSMGGIGVNHLAHRLGDRFAGVLAAASAWDIAYWPCLHGSQVWITQGVNDTTLFRRRHGTDIEFTRLMRQRLEQAGVACHYREHSGGHSIASARFALREWLTWAQTARRDPFHPRVVALTPRGLTPWMDWRRYPVPVVSVQASYDFHELAPSPHARWVSIEGVGDETVLYDRVVTTPCRDEVEDDWDEFRLELRRKHIRAGLVEAFLVGDNTIELTPRNVTALTLWLHPAMVDLDRVRVIVNGLERHHGPVRPSLATLLESYLRRRDWGLLYPARLTIENDGTWETPNQISGQ